MGERMTKIGFLVFALLLWITPAGAQQFLPEFEPQSSRLKDIGDIQTMQEVQLIGYGLIVGLEGVGDGRGAPFSAQSLANLMRNMGVEVDPGQIRAKNAASVMVTAKLGPFCSW